MKPPSIGTYLMGNPLSALALMGLTAWLVWQWQLGNVPGIAPLLAGIALTYAANAYRRIQAYRLWQSEWNAMGDSSTQRRRFSFATARPMLRIIIGGPLWLGFAYGVAHAGHDELGRAAAALFWLATAIIVVGWGYRIWKGRSRATASAPQRDMIVAQCLSVSHHSPSTQQAFVALPRYCLVLFDKAQQ